MPWIEEASNVKFACWGEIKDTLEKDQAVVIKEGKSIEGTLVSIDEQIKEKDGVEVLSGYKYRLKVKGMDKEVLVWSNAAILRQHKALDLKEGEKVRFTYEGQYKTSFGTKGYNVKVAVDR